MNEETPLPRGVMGLGVAGIAPFLATLAWGVIDPPWRILAVGIFIAYGACILSFLGGTRWGMGLSQPHATRPWRFIEAVLPSLLAIAALAMVHWPLRALALLALGFVLWLILDYIDSRWPPAYRRLRLGLSLLVLILHAAWVVLLV